MGTDNTSSIHRIYQSLASQQQLHHGSPRPPPLTLFSRILLHEIHPLFDVLLQIRQTSIQQLLLKRRNLPHLMDLLHPTRAQLDLTREEIDALVFIQRAIHKRRLHHALLPLRSLEQTFREPRPRHRHTQRRRARAIFRLDDLVPTKLHPKHEIIQLLPAKLVPALAQQRHDRRARVAAHDGDVLVGRVRALVLRDEAAGAHDVEGRDAEEALGVVDAGGFEDLGADGHGAVDGVGDHEDVGVRGGGGDGFSEVADYGGVGVE